MIGPGRGECVLVHLGDSDWCIVDSCKSRASANPVAWDYLRQFGEKTLSQVRLIVATHWHDDHIRGLASLLEQSPEAKFACASAVQTKEFLTLVASAGVALTEDTGVNEFAAILETLEVRSAGSLLFALVNRPLLRLNGNNRSFPSCVTSLSPSDETLKVALIEIGKMMPQEGRPQRRTSSPSPNHASIALWIEAGSKRVLLGADLEHTGREGEGWLAILKSHTDTLPAAVFKIPHHGSENADCPQVWTTMVAPEPVAVVTPFTGGVRLPKDSDLERLESRTSKLYCTSRGTGKPPTRDPSVEKKLKNVTSNRRVLDGQPGHVRIRWLVSDEGAQPRVETFNGAYQVRN